MPSAVFQLVSDNLLTALSAVFQFVSDNLLTAGEESACRGRSGGYYADLASDCSSYTLCGRGGRQFGFSCPPGTRFHQQFLVCDHEYRVDCPESPRYFALNELIGRQEQGAGQSGRGRGGGDMACLRVGQVGQKTRPKFSHHGI